MGQVRVSGSCWHRGRAYREHWIKLKNLAHPAYSRVRDLHAFSSRNFLPLGKQINSMRRTAGCNLLPVKSLSFFEGNSLCGS